jgi:hypothetical protein
MSSLTGARDQGMEMLTAGMTSPVRERTGAAMDASGCGPAALPVDATVNAFRLRPVSGLTAGIPAAGTRELEKRRMQWTPRPRLSLAPDEPDQVRRLQRFRADHPGVVIGPGESGTWQARIPRPSGEIFITRYRLVELLDQLDELMTR